MLLLSLRWWNGRLRNRGLRHAGSLLHPPLFLGLRDLNSLRVSCTGPSVAQDLNSPCGGIATSLSKSSLIPDTTHRPGGGPAASAWVRGVRNRSAATADRHPCGRRCCLPAESGIGRGGAGHHPAIGASSDRTTGTETMRFDACDPRSRHPVPQETRVIAPIGRVISRDRVRACVVAKATSGPFAQPPRLSLREPGRDCVGVVRKNVVCVPSSGEPSHRMEGARFVTALDCPPRSPGPGSIDRSADRVGDPAVWPGSICLTSPRDRRRQGLDWLPANRSRDWGGTPLADLWGADVRRADVWPPPGAGNIPPGWLSD